MEALSARFNALQENLMDLYESGVETLETQIQHWNLLRQEQILFHYARKHGIMRLGYQPVPPLATSEIKAKDAIAMGLLLESLQKSKFSEEPWTLVETSLETVRSPPADCFKKGPKTVEVYFDGNPENLMLYTVWTYIYYQTEEDTWEKVEGQVDYAGAYFMEGHFKNYYIRFEEDAKRFSTTNQWEVHVNKDVVFTPVTSSTPPVGDAESSNNSVPGPALRSPSPPTQRSPRHRRYGRKPSSPTTTSNRRQKIREKQRQKTATRRRKSRSRSRSSRRRGGEGSRRSSSRGSSSSPDRGGRSRGGPITRSRSRSRSRTRGYSTGGGIAPDQVGTAVRSVGKQHHGRVAQLLADAKDPPVILLRGDANTLKCFRYRFRKKYAAGFQYISTTWSWVEGKSNDRVGRSRMLISFHTEEERELCLEKIKLPYGVEWSYGHFDDL